MIGFASGSQTHANGNHLHKVKVGHSALSLEDANNNLIDEGVDFLIPLNGEQKRHFFKMAV